MSDPRPDEHAWFRARLEADAMDLLDDDERARFEAHADACAACRAALKHHRENPPVSRADGHIPARLIARWDRASRRLRGLPRRLVREHLENCAACRQDLETLGYAPVLERVAELEGEGADSADPLPVAEGPHEIRVVRGGTPAERWRQRLTGAAIGAAAALAAALAILPNLARRPEPSGPAIAPPVSVAPPAYTGGVLSRALRFDLPTRGAPAKTVRLRVGADTRFVHLALPDLFLADTTELAIVVSDPSGSPMIETTLTHGEAVERTLLVGRPERALEPGTYRTRIAPRTDPPVPAFELAFELYR